MTRHAFTADENRIVSAHRWYVVEQSAGHGRTFARGKADIQICTALLQPLTRVCTPWRRSQFWLALRAADLGRPHVAGWNT